MSYVFHCMGRYGRGKASLGRPHAFLVPPEIHARSYWRTSGREKGEAVLDVGGRTSSGASSRETQRTEISDRVDYPDKESMYSMGGNLGLTMYIVTYHQSRNKR